MSKAWTPLAAGQGEYYSMPIPAKKRTQSQLQADQTTILTMPSVSRTTQPVKDKRVQSQVSELQELDELALEPAVAQLIDQYEDLSVRQLHAILINQFDIDNDTEAAIRYLLGVKKSWGQSAH